MTARRTRRSGSSAASGTLLAALLGAGMRMDPYPYVYCSSDGARPHPAYVPYAAFLV